MLIMDYLNFDSLRQLLLYSATALAVTAACSQSEMDGPQSFDLVKVVAAQSSIDANSSSGAKEFPFCPR